MKIERIDAVLASLRPSGGFSFTDLEHAELLYLLRCARAWAELEEQLKKRRAEPVDLWWNPYCNPPIAVVRFDQDSSRGIGGPDLLTATEAALARAKESQ